MSKNGFGQMYRRFSSKLLDLVVIPHVLGEVPTETQSIDQTDTTAKKVTCYVLQNYSRSNALVVDGETRRLKLNPALDRLQVGTHTEKASVLFLQHHDENNFFSIRRHMLFRRAYYV